MAKLKFRPFRWLRGPRKRLGPGKLTRSMMIELQARRIHGLARAHGISPDELEDAVQLLASAYPVTFDDVLAVVEDVGLDGARARLDASMRGES